VTEVVSTETTSGSYNPSLAVDNDGNIHIAWQDYTNYDGAGTGWDIFYKRWDESSSSWTVTEFISTESTEEPDYPSLAVDSDGNVHVAWQDETDYASAGTDWDIFYKRWDVSTSTWTTTEVVSTESTGNSNYPSLAVDAIGNVHIAWHDITDYGGAGGTFKDIFYKYWNTSSSSWMMTEVVSTESIAGAAFYPSLAVNNDGDIHIAWEDWSGYAGSGTDQDIFYKRWNSSTSSWTTTEIVSTESTGNSLYISLATDTEGGAHLAWNDYTDYDGAGTDLDIFYKRWDDSTSSWTTTEVVSTESTELSRYPSIAVDTLGNTHIAWQDTTDYDGSGTDGDVFYIQFAGPPVSPELAFIVPNPTELPTIYLDWNNIIGATSYHVYRSTSYIWSVEGLQPITSVTSSDFIDSVPSAGFYYYAVVAGNFVGNSSHSNCQYIEVKFADLAAPELAPILPNPTELSSISLVWGDVDGATEYHIYRSASYIWSVEGLTPIDTVATTSYIDSLPSEGTYFYVIVASDGSRLSIHSNCQYIEVVFPDLDSPDLAPLLPNPTELSSISLVWDDVDGATEYHIYRSISYIWTVEGLTPIATVVTTSFVDSLPSEDYYFYVIVASDGLRNSTLSNCEYVEYKLPALHEFFIISSLILGIPLFLFVVTRIRKKNSKLN